MWFLLAYLRRHDFTPFVIYRVLVAVAILVIIVTGLRAASGPARATASRRRASPRTRHPLLYSGSSPSDLVIWSPARAHLSLGDRGKEVIDVQQRLCALGFELGDEGVDGFFGRRTQAALRAFQQRRGLLVDGVVGANTWRELVEAGYELGDRLLYLRVPPFRGDDVLGPAGQAQPAGLQRRRRARHPRRRLWSARC